MPLARTDYCLRRRFQSNVKPQSHVAFRNCYCLMNPTLAIYLIHASFQTPGVRKFDTAQVKYPRRNALTFTRPKGIRSLVLLAVIAALAILVPVAHAATVTWTNTASDYYTNSANWDAAAVPGSADTADIANNGTVLYTDQM